MTQHKEYRVRIHAEVVVPEASTALAARDLLLQTLATEEDPPWEGYDEVVVESLPWWNQRELCQIPFCGCPSLGPHLGLCHNHLVCPNCGNFFVEGEDSLGLGGLTFELELYETDNGEVHTEVLCDRCEKTWDTRTSSPVPEVVAFLDRILPKPVRPLGCATNNAQPGELVGVAIMADNSPIYTKLMAPLFAAAAPIAKGELVIRCSQVTNQVKVYT